MADETPADKPVEPSHAHECGKCGAEKVTQTPKLPRGWKDVGGPTCGSCVQGNWVVRAVTLPVAAIRGRVADRSGTLEPVEGFLRHFLVAWRRSTDLANWTQEEILRRDVRRRPDMETLPRYESPNLYRCWNEVCPPSVRAAWAGATGTASTVIKAVEDVWRTRNRLLVLWRGDMRAAHFRFPYPWPVRKQDVRLAWADTLGGRVPTLSVPLPGGRFVLDLDRSPEFRRQLADFQRLVSGEAVPGDVRLVPVQRGGRTVGVKATTVGRFRRTPRDVTEAREARVTTTTSALFVVTTPDREPWVLHAQHLRGVVACHRRWLDRRSDDLKHEWRWPAKKRERFVRKGQAAIDRNRGRIKSEIQQASAAVVGLAVRQRCGVLVYDDSNRDFLPSWPWHDMALRVRQLCDANGLRFLRVGPGDAEPGTGEDGT